jgi:SAM-dependent methyltransferase
MPVGKPVRFNAICPNCYTVERHRLLWFFLFSRKNNLLTNGMRLLHIAPERVFFKKFKQQKKIFYFPADKFMPRYKYPKGTKNIDICQIDYPDNFFDAILCIHVLEHIYDDKQAMQELYRVLKPDGWAILQVPVDYSKSDTFEDSSIVNPDEREKYFGQYDHLRLYGKDYPQRLEQVGFKVDGIDFGSTFSEQEKQKFGFDNKDRIIYLCTK